MTLDQSATISGGLAELKFIERAVRRGVAPFKAVIENNPSFDYLIELESHFVKVQVKKLWARRVGNYTGYACGNMKKYCAEGSYDFLAAVCFELDRVWLIPHSVINGRQTLVISETKLHEWQQYEF